MQVPHRKGIKVSASLPDVLDNNLVPPGSGSWPTHTNRETLARCDIAISATDGGWSARIA